MTRVLARMIPVTFLLALSCAPGEASLLEDEDLSQQRLRRMNLTVEEYGGTVWEESERSVSDIEADVRNHCNYTVREVAAFSACAFSTLGPIDCDERACLAQLELCRALRFREMAEAVAPVELPMGGATWPSAGDLRVAPQDAESRVALNQAAQNAAKLALEHVGEALTVTCSAGALETPFNQGSAPLSQPTGELLASTLREALEVGEAAADAGTRGLLGIADRDRTTYSDLGQAARLTWFDDNLSRLLAVQTQTGGIDDSAPGGWTFRSGSYLQDDYAEYYHQSIVANGIGSHPPCRGNCARAAAILRQSGAPFQNIINIAGASPVSLDALIMNDVGLRLAALVGAGVYDYSSAEAFASGLRISTADLQQARAWMLDEAAILARPKGLPSAPTPSLPPTSDGTPPSTSPSFDATTMARPTPPPAMHYLTAARAARLGATWQSVPTGSGANESARLPVARPGRAYLFAYANAVAREAMARLDTPPSTNPALPDSAMGVLSTIARDATARRALDVEVCMQPDTALSVNGLRIRVFGLASAPAAGELYLVEGTTEMRCAVEGVVEGQPCSAVSFYEPDDSWSAVPAGVRLSRLNAAQWDYEPSAGSGGAYAYIVRLREDRTPGPGAYEAVAGIPLPLPEVLSERGDCITIPYDFTSNALASSVFALRGDLSPSHLCGDIDLDGPLPLEDEIIDDGDPYEDSWQHHLRVAAAAAQHADELGQQLIQSGLEMDRLGDHAVDEIQALCGVAINLSSQFDESGSLATMVIADGCEEGVSACSSGYECVGTQCVLTSILPDDSFERTRLLECLGLGAGGQTVPVVALAGTPLCYWYNTDSPQILCEGAPQGTCPFPVPEDSVGDPLPCPTMPGPTGFSPARHTMESIANAEHMLTDDGDALPEVLDLVQSVSPDRAPLDGAHEGGVPPPDGLCERIRAARADTAADWDTRYNRVGRIKAGGFFSYENVRYWAGRIGWRAYPRDLSEITLDGGVWTNGMGNPVASSGYPFAGQDRTPGISTFTGGVPYSWPCAPYTYGASGTGLFAGYAGSPSCANQDVRARWNRRMGRAAATLAALSGVGLGELLMPAYYDGIQTPLGENGPVRVFDWDGNEWLVAGSADFSGDTLSGWIVSPVNASSGIRVWTSEGDAGPQYHDSGSGDSNVNPNRPFAFVNYGARYEGNDRARADNIARILWEGMQPGAFDRTGSGDSFFNTIALEDAGRDEATPYKGSVFYRSLIRLGTGDGPRHRYINHGRDFSGGGTSFDQLSQIFSDNAYDLSGPTAGVTFVNRAHLFEEHSGDEGYDRHIYRRDLLDAMELMCEVAAHVPSNDVPPVPSRPVVLSMADVGSVQIYAERVADQIDAMAERQIVQNVPLSVVESVQGDSTSIQPPVGSFGDSVTRLKMQLRTLQNAPRDIANALRSISTAIDIMERQQAIFDRTVAVRFLGLVVSLLNNALTCVGASGKMNFTAGASCGIATAISVLQSVMTLLEVENDADSFRIQFDTFTSQIGDAFDLIESRRTDMENATDQTRIILNELRSNRIGAQSAFAGALFASSDQAGRHYPVNTAMRRVYDINLQRYRDAQRAAVRSAAVARMAVEQRFGVSLEDQTCASLVDAPSTWAADVCNTSGVNYADLRNPDVEVGPDAIRSMFVGDYVRRLEQYVESYRFDFPYTSGDDVVVVSLRDDVVRATSPCVQPIYNLLGASNDLGSQVLPNAEGDIEPEPPRGWRPPINSCSVTTSGFAENCVQVRSVDGPRIAVHASLGDPGPVPGLFETGQPRGFEVVFAPGSTIGGTGYESGYTDATALTQEVALTGGTYRLSWYAKGPSYEPSIDARTTVTTPSGSTVYEASDRAMTDGWKRHFRFISVPSSAEGTLYQVGVFPASMESALHDQAIRVAGLQLENVSGTDAAYAPHGPGLFAATTAPAFATDEACVVGDLAAFRSEWSYRCTRLCSGGFGSERCLPDEEPQTYCYWELPFQMDEDRLLGRGAGFGGGFAFGNYNYRTGDIAVNVVGTGVRNCDGMSSEACYATGGIPFSLSHTPPGFDGDDNAYTVRGHDGSLQPVHLHAGWIESARALATERYLTNPLSSSDRALIGDYVRGEMGGRPMTGSYRLIIWDVPGVEFHRIEDVQILWRYRYFTRTGQGLVCGG